MPLVQKFIVEDASKASSILPQHVALVNPDGSPVDLGGTVYGAATTTKAGLVKKASGVAAVASADPAVAAGAAPTKAEFDKVVTIAVELKKQLNAALSALKSGGIMA